MSDGEEDLVGIWVEEESMSGVWTGGPWYQDRDLERGDSVTYRLEVREPKTGAVPKPPVINLTGADIRFEAKKKPDHQNLLPTDPVVISKTSDNVNEIEVLDQTVGVETEGQCLIKLGPEDTEFLEPGVYAYSVRVTTADGFTRTVTKGRIFLKGPATAAENQTPPH